MVLTSIDMPNYISETRDVLSMTSSWRQGDGAWHNALILTKTIP